MTIDPYYHKSMVDTMPNQTNISQTFNLGKIMLEETGNGVPENWGRKRQQTTRT